MDDINKALNAEVSKLIKWDAVTAVEEAEVEAQIKVKYFLLFTLLVAGGGVEDLERFRENLKT